MNTTKYIRANLQRILSHSREGKVSLIIGPRRVGKTLLLKALLDAWKGNNIMVLNAEDMDTSQLLQNISLAQYSAIFAGCRIIVIDEAQHLPNAGYILKFAVDNFPRIKFIVTGSSAFDLGNNLGEPLTGRKQTFFMYPLSIQELCSKHNPVEINSMLENLLVYGSYPDVILAEKPGERASYLKELVNDYLFKDVLKFENMKHASKLIDLLRLLAWQLGGEVSLEELGRNLQISKNTVIRYLDLLSKVYVIFKLPGLSRNLRNEITKTSRWYFYDNGVRNALISNFNSLALRNDVGQLWENFMMVERMKFQEYNEIPAANYFWRTYTQKEIDLVEEKDGFFSGFEFKWSGNKAKAPADWIKGYPDSAYKVINRGNYLPWLLSGETQQVREMK